MELESAKKAKTSVSLATFRPVVRIPVRLHFEFVIQMYVLGFAKLFEAFGSELAAPTRHAHAAEWSGIVVGKRIVDPERAGFDPLGRDRKSTRLNSSHLVISYAVFC